MRELLNLYPFLVFRAVARRRSMTRAAEELLISQPAVTAQIRLLEGRLGQTLLDRTHRGLVLTPAGEVLAERVGRLLAEIEDLRDAVTAAGGRVDGELRLAASSTPGAYLMPLILAQFRERYPAARPTLFIRDSMEALTLIRDYEVSAGIVGRLPLPGAESEWRWTAVAADELRLVTASASPIGALDSLGEDDLRRQTLLLREQGSSTRAAAEQLLGARIALFQRVVEMTSTEALKEWVIQGMGMAVLSSWATHREEQLNLLVPVRDGHFRMRRPFYLVRRADRTPMGPAAAFWQFTSELCERLSDGIFLAGR